MSLESAADRQEEHDEWFLSAAVLRVRDSYFTFTRQMQLEIKTLSGGSFTVACGPNDSVREEFTVEFTSFVSSHRSER